MSSKKSFSISLDILSRNATPEIMRLNPELFGSSSARGNKPSGETTVERGCMVVESERSTSRPRMSILNKTETRYYDTFLADGKRDEGDYVVIQATRFFDLEGGGTYTPDFMVFHPAEKHMRIDVIEIKGGYIGHGWEQGIERYRRVASQYDGKVFAFTMCTWDNKMKIWKKEKWSK